MPYNHCTILIAKVKTWLPPILLTYAANGERREQTFKPTSKEIINYLAKITMMIKKC